MASFFKTLFRKDEDSQPVPAAPLTQEQSSGIRPPIFQEERSDSGPLRQRVPTGQSGPFSAVSGRNMTAREIAALLPPALLRYDGISPDQPVSLPLDLLREAMSAGRPVLRLSQISAACPELFQRLPLPEEDIEITLPLARVQGILEFSAPVGLVGAQISTVPVPAASASAPLADGNPFASIKLPSALPRASPFAPATPVVLASASGNPFATTSVAAAPMPLRSASPSPFPLGPAAVSGNGSPFSAVRAIANPARLPTSISAAAGSPFAPLAGVPSGGMGSPFAAVKPAEALPTDHPAPSPDASPFSVAAFPAAAGPASFGGASAAPAPSAPSPFSVPAPPSAPVFPSKSPAAITEVALPPLLVSPAAPAASGSSLSWPPPARVAPAPILPQPRTSGIPAARTAPVSVSSPEVITPPSAVVPDMPLTLSLAESLAPAPNAAPSPASPFTAPAPLPAGPFTADAPPARVELSLRAVLRDADPLQLGFVPDNVPETVRVSLPLLLISRQLAGGRVEIGLDDLCAGISEKFRPAFARAQDGLRITIPMSEVFHNLPESERPALPAAVPADAHLSITTSPFQTPFAIKAEEDTSRHLLDLSVTGFNPASIPVRPSTHPVPAAVLPPAPLPMVPPSLGTTSSVQVELPVLRPMAAASTQGASPASFSNPPLDPSALPPIMSRPGPLSRPPGSGTAPTEAPAPAPAPPKSPPRLKSVPVSPTALRAFPKPVNPGHHENGHSAPPLAPLPPLAAPVHSSPQPEIASLQTFVPNVPALPNLPAPAPLVPFPSILQIDAADDLGESFSASTLSAEPPPRAGSAPVAIPSISAPVPASAPSPGFPTLTPAVPAPSWPGSSLAAGVPVADLVPSPTSWPAPGPDKTAPPAAVEFEECGSFASEPPPFGPRASEAQNSRSAATSPLEDLTFGCVTDLRQLTLRAVLGTDQFLTAQDIVDRCAAFPGLQACLLLQPGGVLTSQGMAETEAATFRASAAKTRDSLAALAETIGLGTSGNFTLRTDHGIRSFFLEPGLCLAVSHSHPQFSGGTREKLILIAQELTKSALHN